jgi:3D (Asp-Asp-Asp) domain-containing protein
VRIFLALVLPLILCASVGAVDRPARATLKWSLTVSATAYCQSGRTASGAQARPGIVAADPRVLPLGTAIRVQDPTRVYSGTYLVMDVGSEVKGREIDIFMPSCRDARRFGRQRVEVHVLSPARGD